MAAAASAPIHMPAREHRRIPSLDGLRAVSITLVILAHLGGTRFFPVETPHWFGQFGVQIFFVISGFLITKLLIQEYASTGAVNLIAFYRRRTFRIFPSAYCYIGVVALIYHPPVNYLCRAITYTMSYTGPERPWVLGHLWSLSVEEQFYLLWPFVIAACFRWRKQVAWGVMIAAPACRVWAVTHGHDNIDRYFPTVADSLASGCLLAIYYPRLLALRSWLTRTPLALFLAASTFACAGIFAVTWRLPLYFGGLLPLLIATCIFILVERKDWILNNATMNFVGLLSYSLYLWQQPWMSRANPHIWNAFPFNLTLALICALLSFYLVEQPMIRLGRRTLRALNRRAGIAEEMPHQTVAKVSQSRAAG